MDASNKIIGSFCSELYTVKSFEPHFKIYEKYIKLLGYDGACYTFLPKIQVANIPLVNPVFKRTKHFPQAFLDNYEKQQFHHHDFTIRKGKENCSYIPMDWRDNELNGDLSDEEKKLIIFARDNHGITNAFTIPTQISDAILAGATVISSLPDHDFKQLKIETLNTLDIITKLFHDKCSSSLSLVSIFSKPLLNKLNPTEMAVLRCLVDGIPTKQLADYVEISHTSAKNVICNLCNKLGGINRDQLFFLIGRVNILQS